MYPKSFKKVLSPLKKARAFAKDFRDQFLKLNSINLTKLKQQKERKKVLTQHKAKINEQK